MLTHRRKSVVLGFVDQAISSLTTLLLIVAAAQWLDPPGVGRFAIGIATIAPCVAIIRAFCGETLIVRVTSVPGRFKKTRQIHLESERMLGLAILLSLAAICLILALATFWTGARDVLLASAVAVVGIILQDSVRHYLLTARKSSLLLMGDLFVLIVAVGGIYVLGSQGYRPPAMLIVWGLAALVSACAVMAIDRTRPRVRLGIAWLRETWPSSSAFVIESGLGSLVGYAVVFTLAVFSSDTEVAAYRTAVSVFGVTSLVINFMRTAVLRELNPHQMQTKTGIYSVCWRMSALVLSTVMATALFVYAIPIEWGTAMLGESWLLVLGLAAMAAFNRFAAGVSIAPLIVLRVQGVTWDATKIRVASTVVALVLSPVGAYFAGAAGALAADTFFYLLVATLLLNLSLKQTQVDPKIDASDQTSRTELH